MMLTMQELIDLIRRKCLVRKKVTLSSGKESDYYLNCRILSMDPHGIGLIRYAFWDKLHGYKVDMVGGPEVGAVPLIPIVLQEFYEQDDYIAKVYGFWTRKLKDHGLANTIEGDVQGKSVAIIDDVATSGKSLLRSAKVVEDHKGKVVVVSCLVDREEGARQLLKGAGYIFDPIFSVQSILKYGV
jgi:orotate phosphoribosyltransferase